jgi:hypothetical protein
MIMYILLFTAALKLGRPKEAFAYHIPLGIRRLICFLGLSACILTIIVGYFPPAEIQAGSTLRYALLIGLGNIVLISPVFFLFRHRRRSH